MGDRSLFAVCVLITVLYPTEFCKASTPINHHKRLEEFLLNRYGNGYIRPVFNTSTVTNVSYRLLFHNLLDMDTRSQKFTITAYMKMIWTDQYLTWNSSEFGGIHHITLPATRIWVPDITHYDNVDLGFQRYKPDTYVRVHENGKATWFAPGIFVNGCVIRVKWYPFDTQVCDMHFASWAYDGTQINLLTDESSPDYEQNRYLENGVWDLKIIKVKRTVTEYKCCPEPYIDVIYRLLFQRRPQFYIYYLILPCFFLSILSLFVFYLPPNCGEKLTLSITNLLALVVFQQVIAENVPPSSQESPVIGTYFLTMIILVCVSVLATVMVIHLSANTHRPLPQWAKWIFIDILPRYVGLCHLQRKHQHRVRDSAGFEGKDKTAPQPLIIEEGNDRCTEVPLVSSERVNICDGLHKVAECIQTSSKKIQYIKDSVEDWVMRESRSSQWMEVAMVVDRCIMLFFATFVITTTVVLTSHVIFGSEKEYAAEMDIIENEWKGKQSIHQ